MSTAALIPPEVRARLKALRLRVRAVPAGQGLCQHASRNRGAGLEFAQYRGYEPGDEPRRIDWKLYARSDRYFVRDATRDSPLTVWLLIDTSASMTQFDAARPEYRKLDAAKALAACVAELALQQGDGFGFVSVGGNSLTGVPVASGVRHRDRLHFALAALDAGGQMPNDATLRGLWARIPPDALVVVLSDGFDDALTAAAERLALARREVISIQIISAEERDFPYTGGYLFRDPETGAERRIEGEAARADFIARFAAARAVLARRYAACGIRHVEYMLDEPLDRPLQRLFGARGLEAAAP